VAEAAACSCVLRRAACSVGTGVCGRQTTRHRPSALAGGFGQEWCTRTTGAARERCGGGGSSALARRCSSCRRRVPMRVAAGASGAEQGPLGMVPCLAPASGRSGWAGVRVVAAAAP